MGYEMLHEGDLLISHYNNIYKIGRMLGVGGQGESYEVECNQRQYCLKMFYPGVITAERVEHILKMIAENAPGDEFIWPLDIVKMGNSYGCVQKMISKEYRPWIDILRGKVDISLNILCKIGERLALALEKLHLRQYVLLLEYDYYFNPVNGEVLITCWEKIEKESDVVHIIGTPGLTAPEIIRNEANATIKSDLYVLAVYYFYVLTLSHPLEGKKEALYKCMPAEKQKELYGDNPVFIFDKGNLSNRPVPGYHDNAIIYWKLYPEYLKKMFYRVFSNGCRDIGKRPSEKEWVDVFRRLQTDLRKCPRCGAEVFASYIGTVCWNCKMIVKKDFEDSNILIDIIDQCPDVINNRKKLKAYLMDYIPEERNIRNAICFSFDENIPQEIANRGFVSKAQIQQYKNNLKNSYAISENVAEKVVMLWIEALAKTEL